jgi:hypothetical protein
MSHVSFEVEFRWKEQVIYWEGDRGCVFVGAWGVDPLVTVVPDASTWDRVAPDWLQGRHDEVCERLRGQPGHVVREERDDSSQPRRLEEVSR